MFCESRLAPCSLDFCSPRHDLPSMNSETVSKKKRGRPKVFDDEYVNRLRALYGYDVGDRAFQNKIYAVHAIKALFPEHEPRPEDTQFLWICDLKSADAHKPKAVKWGILNELGRFWMEHGADDTRLAAGKVIDLMRQRNGRLTTREAASYVRRFRGIMRGKEFLAPSSDGLADILITAVNSYMREHPDMTWPQALDATNEAYSAVDEAEEMEANRAP